MADLDSGPDPARIADAQPEPQPVEQSAVRAVGIGPGNLDYLVPRCKQAIREADVVVGFQSVVEFVDPVVEGDVLTCGYDDESETLATFAECVAAGERGTAVLMGDPNHSGYQFLGKVQRAVDAPVRVEPGISALQVAASRARTPMEATTFVTLHRSGDLTDDLDRIRETAGDRHLLILPRPFDWMPGDIAEMLLDAGADSNLECLVLEHLTHEAERHTRLNLSALATHAGGGREGTPFSDLSVLAVRRS